MLFRFKVFNPKHLLRPIGCFDLVNTPVKNNDNRSDQKQGSQNDQYNQNIFFYLHGNRH